MPRLSIVIAAHNEGDLLWQTVAGCRETCEDMDYEIVVADDASEDDCVERLHERFPEVAIHRTRVRHGPSATKDLAAQHARGDVLLFLDAHCKPEPGAIATLLADIDECGGPAVMTPTVVSLDPERWTNEVNCPGHGYLVELEDVTWRWIPRERMRPHGRFLESPTLIGCCFAVSRSVYERVWGFDRNMYMWGVEDVDFGVKSWLLGHSVLHDPVAIIGHRFQNAFARYEAPGEQLIANQIRMAYKVLSPLHWPDWLDRFRVRHSGEVWHKAWDTFTRHRGSAEVERVYLYQHRAHDEVWYARRFGLRWPLTGS